VIKQKWLIPWCNLRIICKKEIESEFTGWPTLPFCCRLNDVNIEISKLKEERDKLAKELELRKKENECFLVEISRRDAEILELDKQHQLLNEKIKNQQEKEYHLKQKVMIFWNWWSDPLDRLLNMKL
jgi:predicted nuclease with TOPRIM domain